MSSHQSPPVARADGMSHRLAARLPWIAAAFLLTVLLGTAMVRWTGVGATKLPDTPVLTMSAFHFQDRPDGSIVISDASGKMVEHVAPGTHGFLRGTMRGLARERKSMGIGRDLPFELARHTDGRLTLTDPGTGRTVDLGSFGPTNAAVFAALLQPGLAAPQTRAPTDVVTVTQSTTQAIKE